MGDLLDPQPPHTFRSEPEYMVCKAPQNCETPKQCSWECLWGSSGDLLQALPVLAEYTLDCMLSYKGETFLTNIVITKGYLACVQITTLNFGGNGFTSTLPEAWGSLQDLTNFNVTSNHLEGALPSNWSTMKAITHIDLSHNSFQASLPDSWPTMPSLTNLTLSFNSLSGSLPSAWCSFSKVTMSQPPLHCLVCEAAVMQQKHFVYICAVGV